MRSWRAILVAAGWLGLALGRGLAGGEDPASGTWTLIYERDLTDRRTFFEWIPVMGAWEWTADGLEKKGNDSDGLVMLRLPLAAGAVKIEYTARAPRPGDLSLFFGLRAGDLYTFNVFDPRDVFFRELGDPDLLRKLPSRYETKPGALGWIGK